VVGQAMEDGRGAKILVFPTSVRTVQEAARASAGLHAVRLTEIAVEARLQGSGASEEEAKPNKG